MAGVLDGVDMRTKLAGHNRLELLLFRLGGRQRFGINVFKVQEVIQCPPLTSVPQSHPVVLGIANMRGRTIAVMDLASAIEPAPASLRHDYRRAGGSPRSIATFAGIYPTRRSRVPFPGRRSGCTVPPQ